MNSDSSSVSAELHLQTRMRCIWGPPPPPSPPPESASTRSRPRRATWCRRCQGKASREPAPRPRARAAIQNQEAAVGAGPPAVETEDQRTRAQAKVHDLNLAMDGLRGHAIRTRALGAQTLQDRHSPTGQKLHPHAHQLLGGDEEGWLVRSTEATTRPSCGTWATRPAQHAASAGAPGASILGGALSSGNASSPLSAASLPPSAPSAQVSSGPARLRRLRESGRREGQGQRLPGRKEGELGAWPVGGWAAVGPPSGLPHLPERSQSYLTPGGHRTKTRTAISRW